MHTSALDSLQSTTASVNQHIMEETASFLHKILLILKNDHSILDVQAGSHRE
jgi:hypothetical protein